MIADTYYYRGYTFHYMDEIDNAIADYSKAITINPKHAWAYLFRAHAYEDKGNYERAFSDYMKANEINPKIEEEYLGLFFEGSENIDD